MRITKTAIRERMNGVDYLYSYSHKKENHPEHHTATVLGENEMNALAAWLISRRISYTDAVSVNKDGSLVHTVTVYFSQLATINARRS